MVWGRWLRRGVFGFVVVLFLPFVWPDREVLDLDDAARSLALGSFVRLREGVVHYQWGGPVSGQVVVLVHGFSTPLFVWEPTFKRLVASGFRVLRLDLFGRGYSDRPDTTYDLSLYRRQILGLLEALEVKGPVSLVGLSMGGAVVSDIASRYPEKIRSLALIAPAGVPTQNNRLMGVAKWPFVGEWLMRILSVNVVVRGASRSYSTRTPSEAFYRGLREQMVYRGYRRALLSSLRHVPLQSMKETYTKMQTQRYPILVVWGQQDRIIPIQSGQSHLKRWLPRAEFVEIPRAGHLPHREAPHLVEPLLVGFLGR